MAIHGLRFSPHNLLANGVLSASSETENFPASTLTLKGRPFRGWESEGLGDQWIKADMGTATLMTQIYLNNANFTTVRFQANSIDDWSSPPVDQALTLNIDPFNWRFQYGALLGNLTYRYWRLLIEDQVPIADADMYALGGWWLGTTLVPPNNFLFDIERETDRGLAPIPLDAGGAQRVKIGHVRVRFSGTRAPKITSALPGLDDQLATWAEVERQLYGAGRVLMQLSSKKNTDAYVIDDVGQLIWSRHSKARMFAPFTFLESVGP